jgi:predicted TPR repeat methyltransferase
MLDPEVIEIKVPKYVDVLKTRYGLENWKQVLDKTAKMMLDLGNGSGLKEEELSRIKTKLLICRGSEDKMVTAKESLRVVSLLSNANYKEFDGFQHPIERVDMDVLAKEIASFGDCNRK